MTFKCAYGRGFSVLEVLDTVDAVLGKKLPRKFGPRRPDDPDALVASVHAIHSDLDWAPRFADLSVIISDAVRWAKRQSAATQLMAAV